MNAITIIAAILYVISTISNYFFRSKKVVDVNEVDNLQRERIAFRISIWAIVAVTIIIEMFGKQVNTGTAIIFTSLFWVGTTLLNIAHNRINGIDKYSGLWHSFQALEWIAALVIFGTLNPEAWRYVLPAFVLWGCLFNGFNNIFDTPPVKWFYVGKTAQSDKFYRIFSNPSLALAITQLIILAASIVAAILI